MKLSYLAIASMLLSSSCTVLFDEGDGGEVFPEGLGPLYRYDFESDDRTQVSSGSSSLEVDLLGPATITDGALDLRASSSGNFGLAASLLPADEALTDCTASNAMSIAVWLTATSVSELENLPSRIVTIEDLSGGNTNFTLGQDREGSDAYDVMTVRTGGRNNAIHTEGLDIDTSEPMFVFFTINSSGRYRLTAGDYRTSNMITPAYDEWGMGYPLVLGAADATHRGWQGLIHHVEFYCRALDEDEERKLREATDPR